MRTRSTALALLLMAGGLARAATVEERARAHYEAGRVQYNLGHYAQAVREFAAGYELVPRPQFLVNLGQAYRRLGQLERAREMYQRFLAEAPDDDRARPQVQQLVAEVEREIAREIARTGQPAPAAAARPSLELTPATRAQAAPVERPGFWRRYWWILPVGAAVVTALAVGIYFGTRPGGVDCGGAEFGCLDLRR
jgi:tetratricopeptide (TPR) repeat protein